MEKDTVKEDFHSYGGTVISRKMRLQVEIGEGTTGRKGNIEMKT